MEGKESSNMRPIAQFLNSTAVINPKHSSTSLFNQNFSQKPSRIHVDYSISTQSHSDSDDTLATASKLYRHRQHRVKPQTDGVGLKICSRKCPPNTDSQIKCKVMDWLEKGEGRERVQGNTFIDYEAMKMGNDRVHQGPKGYPRKQASLTKVNRRRSKDQMIKRESQTRIKGDQIQGNVCLTQFFTRS